MRAAPDLRRALTAPAVLPPRYTVNTLRDIGQQPGDPLCRLSAREPAVEAVRKALG